MTSDSAADDSPEVGGQAPAADDSLSILCTSIEGSAVLTKRLGEAKARELFSEHERIVREALEAHDGLELKAMGDAFAISFSRVTRALECAIVTQRAFAEHSDSAAEPFKVRIGLNTGEAISADDPNRVDRLAAAVDMAERIAAQAEGGEILASNFVRDLVTSGEFVFDDRGPSDQHAFDDPERVYELSWREA